VLESAGETGDFCERETVEVPRIPGDYADESGDFAEMGLRKVSHLARSSRGLSRAY